MVHRLLLEPGYRGLGNDDYPLIPRDQWLYIFNILAVPEVGWTATGEPGDFTLIVGERPDYTAPVEVMKAEWRRYELGVQDFAFKRIVVPMRQSMALKLTGKKTVLLDFFIVHTRDVG
jgi:hypothetical protein